MKSCIKPPKGYLFIGSDFSSLEDRIAALLTKDPNKIKIYTDGYDSHSLRAFAYFPEQMPEIQQKMSRLDQGGKFYRVEIDGKVEYYHEDDLPEDAKRSLAL